MEHQLQRFELNIKYFKKGKQIGGGGFGAVFLAQEKSNKRIFAAKVLRNDEKDHTSQKMIYREINIMMFANHPAIIKFFGYSYTDFENSNNITILMEYAKNGSLASVIEKIRNEEILDYYTNTVRQIILAGIANGMKYLHDCNIIHRDLKPGNVLLDENYEPRITDFGLSKCFQQDKSYEQTMFGGTLDYMAPEIFDSESYGRKADVYAFGILMYQVVTNSIPYPDLRKGKLKEFRFIELVVHEGYRPKFDSKNPIKKSLKKMIEKCWSQNPDERPTFKQIFSKLTKYNGSSDDCFFDDVDYDKFNEYVKSITTIDDPVHNLIHKIDIIEKDRAIMAAKNHHLSMNVKQLTKENEKLKNENEELLNQIKKLRGSRRTSFGSNESQDKSERSSSERSERSSSDRSERPSPNRSERSSSDRSYKSSSNRSERSSSNRSERLLSNKLERSFKIEGPVISISQIMNAPTIDRSKPILGIDLGTSFSTVGIAQKSYHGKKDISIISNNSCTTTNPSVVCIMNGRIYFGEEAIKKSLRSPKNFIYDSKRMLGRQFDDPIIQEYRKNWTFDTVKSETGGILIKVEDKYYEPYQISGMILIELMNLANSQLDEQTNQAIITIPAYFTGKQIEDTKRAAKYANIELIELLKEPLAATFCYGILNNKSNSSDRKKDILIYDFGGGTLDVSYVEIKAKSFDVLASAGDSELGGQDFTNSIFELISPKLDKICVSGWNRSSQFVNNIKRQCEKAKIHLTASYEFEFYFEIPKNLAKSRECTFEYRLNRDEFEKETKHLFDRCMGPVNDVLRSVGRDPHQIDRLILVGGSSYLPMIVNKLYQLTGKEAYHGVSAVDAVAYGACVKGIICLE